MGRPYLSKIKWSKPDRDDDGMGDLCGQTSDGVYYDVVLVDRGLWVVKVNCVCFYADLTSREEGKDIADRVANNGHRPVAGLALKHLRFNF